MAQRRVIIPDVGEVVLAKRRGSSNLRLSITPKGEVRVGMPYWTPYETGIRFVNSKKDWIQSHLVQQIPKALTNGSRIGKSHRLIFLRSSTNREVADIRLTATTIEVKSTRLMTDPAVQKKAIAACERALKMEAEQLLPSRLRSLSERYDLPYNDLKIRKLTSRWGSCSTNRNISLSYFLMQLPWDLIDYVILHELAHTKVLNHGGDYWQFMEQLQPKVKELRKQIKKYKPRIEPA
jgi:predicted metal-dependent hydrolase